MRPVASRSQRPRLLLPHCEPSLPRGRLLPRLCGSRASWSTASQPTTTHQFRRTRSSTSCRPSPAADQHWPAASAHSGNRLKGSVGDAPIRRAAASDDTADQSPRPSARSRSGPSWHRPIQRAAASDDTADQARGHQPAADQGPVGTARSSGPRHQTTQPIRARGHQRAAGQGQLTHSSVPSSKTCRFQIGRRRFTSSTSREQTSNASRRWGVLTAATSATSPTASRPTR